MTNNIECISCASVHVLVCTYIYSCIFRVRYGQTAYYYMVVLSSLNGVLLPDGKSYLII